MMTPTIPSDTDPPMEKDEIVALLRILMKQQYEMLVFMARVDELAERLGRHPMLASLVSGPGK